MKHLYVPLLLLGFLTGCSTPPQNQITQVATLQGLLAGSYDGEIPLGVLSTYGDFGLGTYQALDGEMVFLDDVFYQIKGDGSVETPSPELSSPFAIVVEFNPDIFAQLSDLDLSSLEEHLDKQIPDVSTFVAIKITGTFSSLKARSIFAQEQPYPVLQDVIKNQSVFTFENIQGTLVGFRCPSFVGGLNVPGYHFHFISTDRTAGGHVLSLNLTEGNLEADTQHEDFKVILPKNTSYYKKMDIFNDETNLLEETEGH